MNSEVVSGTIGIHLLGAKRAEQFQAQRPEATGRDEGRCDPVLLPLKPQCEGTPDRLPQAGTCQEKKHDIV